MHLSLSLRYFHVQLETPISDLRGEEMCLSSTREDSRSQGRGNDGADVAAWFGMILAGRQRDFVSRAPDNPGAL